MLNHERAEQAEQDDLALVRPAGYLLALHASSQTNLTLLDGCDLQLAREFECVRLQAWKLDPVILVAIGPSNRSTVGQPRVLTSAAFSVR